MSPLPGAGGFFLTWTRTLAEAELPARSAQLEDDGDGDHIDKTVFGPYRKACKYDADYEHLC